MSVRERRAAERPAVLIVDAHDDRRQALAQGLAAAGYDATPAMTSQEGLKFARVLGPSVIVGPVALLAEGEGEILEHCTAGHVLERTILLLGSPEEVDELPDGVRFLPVAGLDHGEILRRIQLVLTGREVGVETDLDLRFLVGELSMVPFLELVRSLHRCHFTGRLVLTAGYVAFERGTLYSAVLRELSPAAARQGAVAIRGVKAFCRLARYTDGPFRVLVEPTRGDRDIHEEAPDLVMRALEEAQITLPPPRARVRIASGELKPSGEFATHENLLLEMIAGCQTVEELLDTVPSTDGRVAQVLEKLRAGGFVTLERPRSEVRIVTDSTADLPPELAREHEIVVVPLCVVFGDDALRDGIDIQPRDFYQMLETETQHPETQPPSVAELFEHFLGIAEEQDVVAVHGSGRLSQTLEYARVASRKLTGDLTPHTLELVDSRNMGMGVGLLALFAARMALRGSTSQAITRRLREMTARVHTLFAVDTLDYLKRGGRIGAARARIGEFLGIKPILGMIGGNIDQIDQVRGGRQAHARIVKLFQGRVEEGRPIVAAVAHARAPVWADSLRSLLDETFDVAEMIVTDIGPVVGTHVGPGAVGAAVFQPSAEETALIAPLD